jgi:hypothetical protein
MDPQSVTNPPRSDNNMAPRWVFQVNMARQTLSYYRPTANPRVDDADAPESKQEVDDK